MGYKPFGHHRDKRDAARAAQEQPVSEPTDQTADAQPETPSAAPALPGLDASQVAMAQIIATAIAQALQQNQGPALTAEAQADIYANAMRVALKPENQDPPLVSAYNPQGERDFPRGEFKCEMRMMGVELSEDTHTAEEIALFNLLEPGDYRVDKADGSQVIVSVEPTPHPSGEGYSRLNLNLRASNSELNKNWLGIGAVLRQMVGDAAGAVPAMPKPARLAVGRVAGVRAGAGAVNDLTDAVVERLQKELPPGVLGEFNTMLATKQDAVSF